jgi:hypothetical protein
MANPYYTHGSFPATGSAATSASMRAELQLVSTGFDKLPTLAGNQNQLVVVNNTGTALVATGVLPPLDAVDNNFAIRDNADATRKFRFEVSTVTPGQTRVLTVPDANTTIVGTDTTQTLTNKTLTLPVIAQISNTGTLTLPTSNDTLVGRATTDTLTNKTLTAPVIATIVNVGTRTLPSSTDTLVGRATTDTLTNKTISGASNTLTNIANGSLTNSSVTIGSTNLSLGGTLTTLSGVTISGSSNTISNIANASLVNSSVTIGSTNVALGATAATVTGLTLTGSAFNGTVGATTPSTGAFTTLSTSGAATMSSGTVGGAAIVSISASQTLTNKSISGSANTLTNIANASLVNSGLTINGVNIALGGTATITAANPNALTIGTGLTGTSYNGSSAVTIAIDSTVATLTGTQTLTNKTINGSNNTLTNIANASLVNSSITIGSTNVALGATAASIAGLTLTGSAFNGTVGATTPSTGVFTTLTENGFPVVSQTDIGTAPNQIPLNQYLGNLAYQNADSIAGPIGLSGDVNLAWAGELSLILTQLTNEINYVKDIAGITAKAISGGEILIGLGTAALPSISLVGNRSTGIFFPATDTIAAATNGLERLRLDTDGHLLVGATTQITNTRLGVRGATADSAQNAFLCKNSGDFDLFQVRNDGLIATGTRTQSPYNATTGSAANLFVDSTGILYRSTSSQKYKTEIEDAEHGLAEVMALRSVTYKSKTDGERVFVGFVAEEVHAIGLTEFVEYAEDGTPDALAYSHMVALLTKAIQELKAEVDDLKAQIN